MKRSDNLDVVHTGPNSLAGKYLRRFWQPVYVAADLRPGHAQRLQIMGEYFTLYRGERGAPHLLADRCAHRQTQLSLGWVEEDHIRCFYHGWKYDASGRCVEQPGEKASFARKTCVSAYPTEEYLGLIFGYFGGGKSPRLPRYPELEDEASGELTTRSLHVPCNYFQRIENDADEVHVHFVHKPIVDRVGMTDLPEIVVTETEYGFRRESIRRNGEQVITRTAHILMPNGLLVMVTPISKKHGWATLLAWRVPIDDENTLSFMANRAPSTKDIKKKRNESRPQSAQAPSVHQLTDAILAGRLRIQDVDRSYPHLFNVQDNVVLAGQGRIVDRSKEQLGKSDIPVIMLRKLWQRELKRMAEGQPLKKWKRPSSWLEVDTGIEKLGGGE